MRLLWCYSGGGTAGRWEGKGNQGRILFCGYCEEGNMGSEGLGGNEGVALFWCYTKERTRGGSRRWEEIEVHELCCGVNKCEVWG